MVKKDEIRNDHVRNRLARGKKEGTRCADERISRWNIYIYRKREREKGKKERAKMHGGRHAPIKNLHSKEWQESANRKRERERRGKKLQSYAEGEDVSSLAWEKLEFSREREQREQFSQVCKLRSMRHDDEVLSPWPCCFRVSLLFNGKKRGDSSIQYQTYITSRCIYKYTGRLQRPAGGDTSRALSTLYTDPLRAL